MKHSVILLMAILLAGCADGTATMRVNDTGLRLDGSGELVVTSVGEYDDWSEVQFRSDIVLHAVYNGQVVTIDDTSSAIGHGPIIAGQTVQLCRPSGSGTVSLEISMGPGSGNMGVRLPGC